MIDSALFSLVFFFLSGKIAIPAFCYNDQPGAAQWKKPKQVGLRFPNLCPNRFF